SRSHTRIVPSYAVEITLLLSPRKSIFQTWPECPIKVYTLRFLVQIQAFEGWGERMAIYSPSAERLKEVISRELGRFRSSVGSSNSIGSSVPVSFVGRIWTASDDLRK